MRPPAADNILHQYQEVPDRKLWMAWMTPPAFADGDAALDEGLATGLQHAAEAGMSKGQRDVRPGHRVAHAGCRFRDGL